METMTLFDTYQDQEEVKPLMRIGDFGLVKWQKKEESLELEIDEKDPVINISTNKTATILGKKVFWMKEKKQRGITNQRQSIVKEFVDEINKERINTKYKPVTGRAIAIKLSVFKTNQELYEFLSECRDFQKRNGSFSKRFFGGFKEQSWKQNLKKN